MKLEGILDEIFKMSEMILQKMSAEGGKVAEDTIGKFRKNIREILHTYKMWKPVKVGGLIKGKRTIAYHDVTIICYLYYNNFFCFFFLIFIFIFILAY